MLQLSGPLEQRLVLPEYRVFIRHGHEYDWLNAEYNFEFVRRDVDRLDDRLYRYACLGDWLAIDIATRIPFEFKRLFGNDAGAADIYRAIVEIDDVRPLTSVFQWLQSVTGPDSESWKKVRRAIEEALRNAFADEFIQRWIRSHDRPGFLDRVDFFKYVVKPLSRNVGVIPDSMVQSCLNFLRGKEDRTTTDKIVADVDFAKSGMSLLCHGHYHDGGVSFLDSQKAVICTGSWRAQHSLCHDGKSYFKGRCLSYASFYAPGEIHRRGGSHHSFSFEYHQKFAAA
jgi:UDP-2,3-diacylglucosamine pyrophosphatase LpxH